MKLKTLAARAALLAWMLPLAATAQNIAIVNGKSVPKSRLDTLLSQAQRTGQQVTPEVQVQARDQVVLREIFAQEAEKRGIGAGNDFRMQMELARQSILIRELFEDYKKKNPISDEAAKVEYDKFKAQATGTEYRARHILVEKEDEAKALIVQIKGGAKFDDLPRNTARTPAPAPTAATLTLPRPTVTCPSSAKRWAS